VASPAESATGATVWITTNNNYVEFTGVQLEKGTIATPFEFRPYPIELQLCQRYYQTINGNSGQSIIGIGYCSSVYGTSSNALSALVTLPVPLRALPTISGFYQIVNQYGIGYNSTGNAYNVILGNMAGGQNINNLIVTSIAAGITLNTGSNASVGIVGSIYVNANGYIGFSAELQ
jgi:hypothetical protein